ncbi:MAG TPA: MaoC family dehydratase [Candidatus Methylomirabilis sp.]|nr:MaoC family dehydratase [Candidatus Methylomirabilis sp.]
MTITRARTLKEYTFDRIEVGEEFGPVEGILSELKLKLHAFAVDDYGPWYFQQSPFGPRIGHPTLLANDILMLFTLGYDMTPPCEAGLHARNELEFLRPIFVGQRVSIRGKHVEKYQKRAQNYRVLEGVVLDEMGQPLLRMRATETVGLSPSTPVGRGMGTPPPDAITGEVPPGAPTVCQASRWVPTGAALPSLGKRTSFEQSVAYSGFPFGWVEGGARAMWYNQHTDPEDARRHGHPDAVFQGLCSAAYISEMCTNFFGPSWLTTGRLATAFIRPVIVQDTITASGLIKRFEEEGGRPRLWLDVWCKNQRGELTTVGRASALVQ